MREAEPLFAERILAGLNQAAVDYVVIGALAATFHGSPLRTEDLDICPAADQENLIRLSRALQRLEAKEWDPRKEIGVDRSFDAKELASDRIWILVTKYGPLEVVFRPSGTDGYPDLVRSAVVFDIDGLEVRVAALADVIRSKEATGREKDRNQLPTLRTLLEKLRKQS